MRYFLQFSYNGKFFHGWQIQPNAISVQEVIESALTILLRRETSIVGAGRTDTGVNARVMFAHFDTDKEISDSNKFLLSLNKLAGKDIAFHRMIHVPHISHARFDAISRTYKYFVAFEKNPFFKNFFWLSNSKLDITAMNIAARKLLTTIDFSSFAKLHSDAKTNICNVTEACWKKLEDDIEATDFLGHLEGGIVFTITANRFLRNMVRAIVGTLIDVGKHKISIEHFQKIIDQKDRCSAGTSMPGEALFLWNIKYPYIS